MKTQFCAFVTAVLFLSVPTGVLSQAADRSQDQTRVGPARDPQVSEVFSFKPYEFATHPLYDEITAFWQHNPGTVLDIALPLGASVRFDLRRLPRDTWVDLQDASGQSIPLSIFVHSRGPLFGKWLE